MDTTANEMENLLSGYSDTLQFILQFLHTEGFEESENVLMQEIERRLPALLEEKLAAAAGASDVGICVSEEEPANEQAEQEDPLWNEKLDKNDVNIATLSGRSGKTGTNSPNENQVSSITNTTDISAASHGSSKPEMRKTLSMPVSSPAAETNTFRSLSLPSMFRHSCVDEYSDDDDAGYTRIEVFDQETFLATEIEPQEDLARGSEISSEAGEDCTAVSSSGNDGLGCGQHSRSSSASTSSSSCRSSYFSGEVSEEIHGGTSRISDFESPTQEAVLVCGTSENGGLPPADGEEEIFIMGLDPSEIQQSVPSENKCQDDNNVQSRIESPSTSEAPGIDFQTPGDLVPRSISVATKMQDCQVQGEIQGAENPALESFESEDAAHERNAAAMGGLDFAFPITPTAEDPSAVFTTWTHLRSHSVSNASELSGFSPSQQSPERGIVANSLPSKSPQDSAPGAPRMSNSGPENEYQCQETLDLVDSGGFDIRNLEIHGDAPNLKNSQASRRQMPEESEKQALFVLEALEHAQNSSGQVPKERFGSYGSHFSGGSPEATSPLTSATEMVTLWTDEEAQGKVSSSSSEPGAELGDQYPSGDYAPDGDLDAEDKDDTAANKSPVPSVQEHILHEDAGDKAEDLEVMQYDTEQLSRKYEIFNLQIVHRKNHTGFEETKDFPIRLNDCIAGRYQILDFLGSAAFSRAVQALDLKTGMLVCLKIIKNNKDYFDQSLDEIKLLSYVNSADLNDTAGILQMYDYFYYKEHLFIVCELLRANLYEFQKYNRDSGDEPYFTLPRLQAIARQVLNSLTFLHGLNLIHSDLKPENILIKSYSRCEVKVIDLGSSCFTTDHLSNYVQSRSYRAPEVILGQTYDQRIDIWSLGCILAELASGYVLFQNDSLATLIARLIGILGPFPRHMLKSGRYVHRFFTRSGHPYERSPLSGQYQLLRPKMTSLAARVPQADKGFLDFLHHLLRLDPAARPTAAEALEHPWLRHEYPTDSEHE